MKLNLHSKQHTQFKSLNRKLVASVISTLLIFAVICYLIMIVSMRSLTDTLLLDNLQPLAHESAYAIETNLHLLADRMMGISKDSRLQNNDISVLDEARTIYELHTIGIYDLEGNLISGDSNSPALLEEEFFSLLKKTDNLTTSDSTVFQDKLGITMGMPIKQGQETEAYVVGVYKYDMLQDALSGIHIGHYGKAHILGPDGELVAYEDQKAIFDKVKFSQMRGGSYDEIESRLISGATGAVEESANGETMFLSFAPIRGTQWSLVIEMPKSDYNPLIYKAVIQIAIVSVILLILSICWTIRLARSISKPVGIMTNRMVGLSDGDLHNEVIKAKTGDELELLSTTLEHTVTRLNCYIEEIDRVLEHIASGDLDIAPQGEYKGDFGAIRISLANIIDYMNETIRNFQESASQLNHMAVQLKESSAQLYHSSVEQSNSSVQLVSEVSQVRSHLSHVTDTAGKTHEKASDISKRTEAAGTKMDALSNAMDSIRMNTQNISQIASSIADIAEQTNLLAINAAIEATRAGAAGKGFGVVAGEVRALAAKSAEAARSASEAVSNTQVLVKDGVLLAADTAESVESVVAASAEISGFAQNLFQAVQQQETALTNMEDKIATISEIAKNNQQSAQESEESSRRLSQESEHLQKQVQKFRLKGE